MIDIEDELKRELKKFSISVPIKLDSLMQVPMKTQENINWIWKDIQLEITALKYNDVLLQELTRLQRKKVYRHEIAHILTEKKFVKILKEHQHEFQRGSNFNVFIKKNRIEYRYERHGEQFKKIALKIGGYSDSYIKED